jgi:cobalamin biosynthesis protein CobT
LRLQDFINEDAVSKALDLPEPEVDGDYPPEKVKRYLEMINKALEAMKSKEENDANDGIVADLRDKKKKWGSVDKETKPVKTKQEIPPEQAQDDDPDTANPPPEKEEEPPPEEEPEEEEPPPEEEEEEEPKNGKKKKKKNPFKKEDIELMTPFEKRLRGIYE